METAMKIIIWLVVLTVLYKKIKPRIEKKKRIETITNKIMSLVYGEQIGEIVFESLGSKNSIRYFYVDKDGNSCWHEETEMLKRVSGNEEMIAIANEVYRRLSQRRYEIVCGTYRTVIRETLDYRLKNQVSRSEKTSVAPTLKERLKDISPEKKDDGARERYIHGAVNQAFDHLINEMENRARNTVYSKGAKARAQVRFDDSSLLNVKVEKMECGAGTFVSVNEKRGKWSITPSPVLADIVTELKKKWEKEKITSSVAIEVSVINYSSGGMNTRELEFPFERAEVDGEWGDRHINAAVVFNAVIDY